MKKSHLVKRGLQDANQPSSQPDKVGWIRRYCGKGLFRKVWHNRFVMLKGDHLYIFEKEMKNDGKTHEVFDLARCERSEELRKTKSHSKRSHSKFTLICCPQPGKKSPNLVFLAVSPEEKESWINVLNAAITRAKNRILDEITIEKESILEHHTCDRARIPLGRRLPTRGHLMAVAHGTSDGMLTLDLVNEEDAGKLDEDQDVWMRDHKVAPGRRRAGTDVSRPLVSVTDTKVKTSSLPRQSEFSWSHNSQFYTPQNGKKVSAQGRNRCSSMDDRLSRGEQQTTRKNGLQATLAQTSTGHLQDLITQRLQRTRELLAEIQEQGLHRDRVESYSQLRGIDSPRFWHLRGSDSPHSKGSSLHSSPHSKGTDSPSIRAKDSPSTKGKESPSIKSHIKGSESPLSTGSDSPHSKSTDQFFQFPNSPHFKGIKGNDSPLSAALDWDGRREAAEQLLREAIFSWKEARKVLTEVKELQARQQWAGHVKN